MRKSDQEPSETAENLRLPGSIGMFSESFHPVQNGVTTSLRTLVAGLRERSHHVFVFAPAHREQSDPETNVLRFPSFSIFNRDYPVALPFLPRISMESHFHRLKIDLVHTHTPFVLGLTGANIAVSRGIPLVSTYHTMYMDYAHYMPILPDQVTQGMLEVYLPWYYNRCARVICPSEVAAQWLREHNVTTPIDIIPTGIPLPPPESISLEARLEIRRRVGCQPDTPLLLYSGRLSTEKRVGWLIECFAKLLPRIPAARLILVGSGPDEQNLQAQAKSLGVADSVQFMGPTPRQEVDSFYGAADLFCFASSTETQGLVIGEARAAGLPCVTVSAGGAKETVTDGEDGFCVPPDDQDAFVERAVQILGDRALRLKMRKAALENACCFTPETMIDRVLKVYSLAMRNVQPRDDRFVEEDNWQVVGRKIKERR